MVPVLRGGVSETETSGKRHRKTYLDPANQLGEGKGDGNQKGLSVRNLYIYRERETGEETG